MQSNMDETRRACTSPSSWTATGAGRRGAACRAPPATVPACSRCAAWSRPRPTSGSATLALFAFSSDNWRRPRQEVGALMALLRHYLRAELDRLVESGTRLTVIGRRDRLPDGLSQRITEAEAATAAGAARSAHRARLLRRATPSPALPRAGRGGRALARSLRPAARAGRAPAAEIDLLIRSGGEKRLSDFLLWECAYAELCFVDTLWPDFGADDLRAAIADFHRRERRFGDVGAVAALVAAE